jgi:hypothetical protein
MYNVFNFFVSNIFDIFVMFDVLLYRKLVKMNSISLIPILEFSYTIRKDVQRGYPEPDVCGTGWHCSICGESVLGSHTACHMHEVGPPTISGTFCTSSKNKIPDHAQEIIFVLDDAVITLKYIVTEVSSDTNGPKIVSLASVDTQYKKTYYSFVALYMKIDIKEEK